MPTKAPKFDNFQRFQASPRAALPASALIADLPHLLFNDILKGEQKTKMARRPETDVPLTRPELAELQKQFKTMSESAIQSFYHSAYRRCQFVNRPPTARSIQELVAVWKYMRSGKSQR